MSLFKTIERLGRQLIVTLLGMIMSVARHPVTLPDPPRILVIRIDPRVGNLLLLTPLLNSLKQRFPNATIDLLASTCGQILLQQHPALDTILTYEKSAIFGRYGPLKMLRWLRQVRYDLAIDASNPTDPSATQAIIARFCGAAHTVGADQPGFGRLFSSPVRIDTSVPHEIDLRLQLLRPLPGTGFTRELTLGPQAPITILPEMAETLDDIPYAVINIGARLAEKRLSADQYADIGHMISQRDMKPVFTYGPDEALLARQAAQSVDDAILAPPTNLTALAALMMGAQAVISCDTGPMHLAVALNTPTCGIFVNTAPERYGYTHRHHCAVDARQGLYESELSRIQTWIDSQSRSEKPDAPAVS